MRRLVAEARMQSVYRRTDYTTRIRQLTLDGVSPFVTNLIEFHGAITVFCGANGVGKTTLLRIIQAVLSQQVGTRLDNQAYLPPGSQVRLDYVFEGREGVAQSPASPDRIVAPPTIAIDPIEAYQSLSLLSEKVTTTPEYLEGFEPRLADRKRLEILRHILGKEYESFETIEIEDFDGEGALPFFRARADGVSYDSRTMGLGELVAQYIMWQVDRATPGSILLLEEPETAVAPFSQQALLSHLAEQCVRKSLWAVLTTHSPFIVNHVPLAHIRLVSKFQGKVQIETPRRDSDLRDALGIEHPVRGVVFVEDAVAKLFLLHLMEHLSFPLLRECEVSVTGSDGQVLAALEAMPPDVKRVAFVGVLDGDMRAKHKARADRHLFFLPGSTPPEVLFQEVCKNRLIDVATRLDKQPADLARVLSTISDADLHDWIHRLGKGLTTSLEATVAVLSRVWLLDAANREEATRLLESIREAVEINQ